MVTTSETINLVPSFMRAALSKPYTASDAKRNCIKNRCLGIFAKKHRATLWQFTTACGFSQSSKFCFSFRQLSFFGRGARTCRVAYSNGQNVEPDAMPLELRALSWECRRRLDGTTLAFKAAIPAPTKIATLRLENLERRSHMKKLLFAFLLGLTVVSSIVDLATPVSAQDEDPKPRKPEGE